MNILKIFVIIAFIVVTFTTLKLHPDMHQPMIIEDSDFKLTRISDTLSTKNIPVTASTQKPKTTEKIVQPSQNIQKTKKETEKKEKTYKPRKSQDTSQFELLQQLIKESEKKVQQQKQAPLKKADNNFENPYMSEQEEIIAWNKWRSNLQNRIMRDSKIDYAPLGTIFLFTFVVDKYGNISNIKVECSNPNYMDIARNNVKPAISRLQKDSILNFPKGTQRTSTVVTGLFLIGLEERYSTPEDFSDYERVTY